MNSESSLPAAFWQGVAEFNQGEYYACHDTLEELWMEATEPNKTFYQGILQLSVSLYHLHNENLRGAAILLGESIKRLQNYEPNYEGVEVDRLLEESAEMLSFLQHTDPETIFQHPENWQLPRIATQ
ncbi:DUF309 domain-containing protein [Geitlerinema sp. PCC 9228]|jgi:hypothetical protein|uniref:DUF309 domain-containing protein n=1 Tax=Geitlerinema sp. PCC 9228 TaxID=111611 RepID=UPI0008F98B43|nr:DUF309 domain-containing protein [Geitlerinema sp. PCC 9228]